MEDASAARPAAQEVSWREVFRRAPVASLLATGLGAGLLPRAPGTWGSLLGVALGEALQETAGLPGLAALAAASTVVGVPAASRIASIRGREDPPEVVVDEVAGQAIALALLHAALPPAAPPAARWGLVLLAFGLFRALDVGKPGWIDRLQSLPGGWGVMADDLLAGAIAGILSAAAAFFLT